MADLNKVFLMGRLTHDPELRYTNTQAAVANLRLATSRTWSSNDGERKEETLYIDVTVWNRQAENCCQYLKRGRAIHVEGYLKMESWETPAGEKRSKISVVADRVQFLDRREDSPGGGMPPISDDEAAPPARRSAPMESRGPGNGRPAGFAPQPTRRPPAPSVRTQEPDVDEEDIPF